MFLLALGHAVGIDSFDSSKWLAALLAPVALLGTFAAAKRHTTAAVGVAAAAILATDATFVIWSASGLENALFAALLAVGMWRTLEEGESGGFPFAAVAYLGLALTRPDGIAYAALGGIAALGFEAAGARRWKRIGAWLAVFWVPFLAYHAARYAYFAFPLPSTYYAKLDRPPRWWVFTSYGWRYLRDYCHDTSRLWLLPVFLAGATSTKGWRGHVLLPLTLGWAVFLLVPGVEPLASKDWWPKLDVPTWWRTAQSSWVFANALFLPLLSIRAPAWQARMLAWWTAMFGLWFAIASGGDWMRGFRWLSLVAVPLALLFSLGLWDLWAVARDRFGRAGPAVGMVLCGLALLGTTVPQVLYQRDYRPETTPFSVDKRVKHYRWAMRMLDLDYADVVDHDMGAMLYWGVDLGIVRDAKGLADIAFAYHQKEPRFVEEYAFEEYPFELAHGHASTGQVMRRQGRRWSDGYVEFPGYGGRKPHQANYFRKSILVHPWEAGDEHRVEFEKGPILHGIEIPSELFSVRYGLELHYALSRNGRELPRLHLFLFDEQGLAGFYGMPQGAEKFYPTEQWRSGEVVHQNVSLKVHSETPRRKYRLGAVLLGTHGPFVPESWGDAVEVPEEPLVMEGEIHFKDFEVELISRTRTERDAEQFLQEAIEAAGDDDCDRALRRFELARARQARSRTFTTHSREKAREPMAGCLARRAGRSDDREAAVADMVVAMEWQRTQDDVLRVGPQLAQPWYDEALAALDAGEDERAHELLVAVLKVDPSRSWARRHLEDLRKKRLGLK